MNEAQIDLLISLLDPTVRRARATLAPSVTVNSTALIDAVQALTDYRDLLQRAAEESEEHADA